MAVGRWWCGLALVVLVALVGTGASRAGSAGETFSDGGDPRTLRTAVRHALAALPAGSDRRSLLTRVAAALDAGRSVEEVLRIERGRSASVEVLLTGYYEPVLRARRERSARFRHPLYRVPGTKDARTLERAAIDGGALAGRGLEIFWLEDPIESFFLHVQGSGRLDLGGKETARVGYAGNNGHGYRSIGKELVSRGEMTAREATAPVIKAWLRSHPDQMSEILHANARYIYFREVEAPADQGPQGAMGAPLVPFRSVAADPAVTPMGSIGLLTARMPDGSTLRRTVVAMDKGAAIRGETRLDLFIGSGGTAGELAGVLRARGEVVWVTDSLEATR